MPKPPNFTSYMLAAAVWVLLVHIPFMSFVGDSWLFETLPRNVAMLCGLYAVFIPYVVAGLAFFISHRLHVRRLSRESSHA